MLMRYTILLCLTILFSFMQSSFFAMSNAYYIHLSSAWYPSSRKELVRSLKEHEHYAQKHYGTGLDSSKVRAIICPHAGYEYSGNIASSAFNLIKPGQFKRVILLSPAHYDSFDGIGLPSSDYHTYKNLMGPIALDKKILSELSQHSPIVSYRPKAHELEHGVNVVLPFIQRHCGETCSLVPLLVGHINIDQAMDIAQVLRSLLDDQTLLVISADFTHYGSMFDYQPFHDDITQKIFRLDSAIVEQIQNQSLDGFVQVLDKTKATVCGMYPIMVLLALLEQDAFGEVESYVAGYNTSASHKKNPEHCVSYLSLIISNQLRHQLDVDDQLTSYEKNFLLQLARHRLQELVHNPASRREQLPTFLPGLLTSALRQKQGAFVTMHELSPDGNRYLRGCIGELEARRPLYQSVYDMTKSAALHDSRFKPVDKKQLPHIQISISALTAALPIESHEQIKLGRDGVILQAGEKSAVFLPKVPIEQGWNRNQTLTALSKKAGLSNNAWQGGQARFKTFGSIDFAEQKDPVQHILQGVE